jgi:hypothetical protein
MDVIATASKTYHFTTVLSYGPEHHHDDFSEHFGLSDINYLPLS